MLCQLANQRYEWMIRSFHGQLKGGELELLRLGLAGNPVSCSPRDDPDFCLCLRECALNVKPRLEYASGTEQRQDAVSTA